MRFLNGGRALLRQKASTFARSASADETEGRNEEDRNEPENRFIVYVVVKLASAVGRALGPRRRTIGDRKMGTGEFLQKETEETKRDRRGRWGGLIRLVELLKRVSRVVS